MEGKYQRFQDSPLLKTMCMRPVASLATWMLCRAGRIVLCPKTAVV